MNRYKIKKSNHHIDMAAFCDVAFVMLCFLMMAGRPKTWDRFISPPTIKSWQIHDYGPERVITIYLKGEKVFIGFDDDSLKDATLLYMCHKYGIELSQTEINKLNNVNVFCWSMNGLKRALLSNYSLRDDLIGEGIPSDTISGNQLADWIALSQRANDHLTSYNLRVEIVADKDVIYPQIKNLINNLQHYDIKKYRLITYIKPGTANEE